MAFEVRPPLSLREMAADRDVDRTLYAKAEMLVWVTRQQQLPFLAAAIAYYAFLSIVPLIIVSLTVATAVAGQALADELLGFLDEFLTPQAATVLEQSLVGPSGRSSVTIVGLVVLLWSALRVFRGLDIAFSRVYGNTGVKPLVRQLRDALLVFAGIGAALGTTTLVSALLPLGLLPLAGLTVSIFLLVSLPFVFFPLYYIFPASDVTAPEAIPGAIFAGIGWTFLGTAFGIYTSYAGGFQLYGVLGGVLLLLVWFYFGGLILLVGAALNAVIVGRFEESELEEPEPTPQPPATGDTSDDRQQGRPDSDTTSAGEVTGEPDSQTERTPEASAAGEEITKADIEELSAELDGLADDIDDGTVPREEIERALERRLE